MTTAAGSKKTVGIKADAQAATSQPNGGGTGTYVTVDRGGIVHLDKEGNVLHQFRDTTYAFTSIAQVGDKIVVFYEHWWQALDYTDGRMTF